MKIKQYTKSWENFLLKEAFGSNSWSTEDIAAMGDAMMPTPQGQKELSPIVKDIMISAGPWIKPEKMVAIAKKLRVSPQDPDLWVADVKGALASVGGPDVQKLQRIFHPDSAGRSAGLHDKYKDRPTKFDNLQNAQRPEQPEQSAPVAADTSATPVQGGTLHGKNLDAIANQYLMHAIQADWTVRENIEPSIKLIEKVLQYLKSRIGN